MSNDSIIDLELDFTCEEDELSADEDSIEADCAKCSASFVIGYWDELLESYIYLRDEDELPICSSCS